MLRRVIFFCLWNCMGWIIWYRGIQPFIWYPRSGQPDKPQGNSGAAYLMFNCYFVYKGKSSPRLMANSNTIRFWHLQNMLQLLLPMSTSQNDRHKSTQVYTVSFHSWHQKVSVRLIFCLTRLCIHHNNKHFPAIFSKLCTVLILLTWLKEAIPS